MLNEDIIRCHHVCQLASFSMKVYLFYNPYNRHNLANLFGDMIKSNDSNKATWMYKR